MRLACEISAMEKGADIMEQPIYFSKIEFRECAERRENLMPAIQEGRSYSV